MPTRIRLSRELRQGCFFINAPFPELQAPSFTSNMARLPGNGKEAANTSLKARELSNSLMVLHETAGET